MTSTHSTVRKDGSVTEAEQSQQHIKAGGRTFDLPSIDVPALPLTPPLSLAMPMLEILIQ